MLGVDGEIGRRRRRGVGAAEAAQQRPTEQRATLQQWVRRRRRVEVVHDGRGGVVQRVPHEPVLSFH